MSTRFRARDTFVLERVGFVVGGTILEGTIRKGMCARVRMNSALSVDIPIAAIEHIRRKDGGDDVGLVFKGTEDDIQLWKGLSIGEEELEIVEGEPGAPTIA